jgi:Tfp pilus assembly ATPase PilU
MKRADSATVARTKSKRRLFNLTPADSARWPVPGPPPLPGSLLPDHRIVAFYGNPLSKRMGVLGELDAVRSLAESLQAVISQRLLPTKDGKGRVVAAEIMVVTGTIRDAILDPEQTNEIFDLIAEGREQYGSQTFDQHLMDLVRGDMSDFEVAMAAANNPGDFELKMKTLA